MSSTSATSSRPISKRKADLFHIIFILISVILSFTLDFPGLTPLFPDWYSTARLAYIRDSNDPLYTLDPPFFNLFMWMSLFALVPGGLITVRALYRDSKLAPLYLVIYSTYYVTTSMVCYVELVGVKNWPKEDVEKLKAPYIIFGVAAFGIMLDAFFKVRRGLLVKQKSV